MKVEEGDEIEVERTLGEFCEIEERSFDLREILPLPNDLIEFRINPLIPRVFKIELPRFSSIDDATLLSLYYRYLQGERWRWLRGPVVYLAFQNDLRGELEWMERIGMTNWAKISQKVIISKYVFK